MKQIMLSALTALSVAACVSIDTSDGISEQSAISPLELTPAHGVVLKTTSNRSIKQGYVDTPDGQIHYWEAGQGPALLLLHQAGSSSEENAGLVEHMSDKYRLISFDWPGHGMSDDPAREYLTEDYTKSAIAVLDHLNIEQTHIFGNHGGALLAMNVSWKHPDRIENIILSGTSGLKDMEAIQDFSDSLGLDEMNRIDRAGVSLSEAWDRFTRYMPNSEPGEVLLAYMNNIQVRARPFDAHYGVLKFDRRPALDAIRNKRILLMQAENDPFVSDQETLLEILPNAERVVIEDTGVFMLFEAPRETADAISNFLASS